VDVSGIYPALTTPFAADGSVALDQFKANLTRYNKTGLAGYVVLGSTGESVLLTSAEAESLLVAGKEAAGPGRRLIAGTGAESTAETISKTNAPLRSATMPLWLKLRTTTSLRTKPKRICDTTAAWPTLHRFQLFFTPCRFFTGGDARNSRNRCARRACKHHRNQRQLWCDTKDR